MGKKGNLSNHTIIVLQVHEKSENRIYVEMLSMCTRSDENLILRTRGSKYFGSYLVLAWQNSHVSRRRPSPQSGKYHSSPALAQKQSSRV